MWKCPLGREHTLYGQKYWTIHTLHLLFPQSCLHRIVPCLPYGFPPLELSGQVRQVPLSRNSPNQGLSIRLPDREALFVNPLNMSPWLQSPVATCFTTPSITQLSARDLMVSTELGLSWTKAGGSFKEKRLGTTHIDRGLRNLIH